MWFPVTVIFLLMMVRSLCGGSLRETELENIKELLTRSLDFWDVEPKAALSDAQLQIDQKELEKRGLPLCEGCIQTDVPSCDRNMRPRFEDRGGNCTCIKDYECCLPDCPILDEEDAKKCVEGKSFRKKIRDCCYCEEYVCEDCATRWDESLICMNPCDVKKTVEDRDRCPTQECKRKPDPGYDTPLCNYECQRPVNGTDDCGFLKKECLCLQPPSCRPDPPENSKCQTTVKIESEEFFQCKADQKTCEPCWTWKIEIQEPQHNIKKCDTRCQVEKIEMLPCGSFNQTCECIEPPDCGLAKPEEIACHTLVKVFSTAAFKCGGGEVCEACFHWKYVADAHKNGTGQVCDAKCHMEVPMAKECGVNKTECRCVGEDRKSCQPQKPAPINRCYASVKQLIDSYTCEELPQGLGRCSRCWQWYWQEPNCEGKYPKVILETAQKRQWKIRRLLRLARKEDTPRSVRRRPSTNGHD